MMLIPILGVLLLSTTPSLTSNTTADIAKVIVGNIFGSLGLPISASIYNHINTTSNAMHNNTNTTGNFSNIGGIFGSILGSFGLGFASGLNSSEPLNLSNVLNISRPGEVIDVSGLNPKDTRGKKVQAGIEAAAAISTALASDVHSDTFGRIGRIAKKLAPFLGAIGPVVNLINLFIPVGPSPELQFMLKQFALINARFDHLFARIDSLERTVIRQSLKAQYSRYVSDIGALSLDLNTYLNCSTNGSSQSVKESRKQFFLSSFENSDQNAPTKLWQGMMSDRALADNIPENIANFTNQNRLRTQNLMKRVLNTILQGVRVQLFYYSLTGDNTTYHDRKNIWQVRIQRLTDRMSEVDLSVVRRYWNQSQTDTDNILASTHGASHKEVADTLYAFLTQKYDWLNWNVIVYNAISTEGKHWVQFCGGFYRFRTHGRNTVVACNSKYNSMDIQKVRERLVKVPNGRPSTTGYLFGHLTKYRFYGARTIFNHIPGDMRGKDFDGYCMYPGLGVIHMFADVHYKAPDGHIVVVDKHPYLSTYKEHSYKIHAFR